MPMGATFFNQQDNRYDGSTLLRPIRRTDWGSACFGFLGLRFKLRRKLPRLGSVPAGYSKPFGAEFFECIARVDKAASNACI